MNISSILLPKYLAILKANKIDGLYLPFSSELMVCLETSKISANCDWLKFFSFLISSSLFFIILLTSICKAYFTNTLVQTSAFVKLALQVNKKNIFMI